MPELPEVETTRRGIAPHITGRCVERVIVRQPKLRWSVPLDLESQTRGRKLIGVERRAKYLLLSFDEGVLMIHLGMSGSLRIVPTGEPHGKHDHVELHFSDGICLRYNDPRRFGSMHWLCNGKSHPLLDQLGPEPLDEAFSAVYFLAACKGRRQSIKAVLMDAKVVVGVGNIYANEALFAAGIDPRRAAGRVSAKRLSRLVTAVKDVLQVAIEQGGTTLKDFVGSDGKPGYFQQQLQIYGREGERCLRCGRQVRRVVIAQRATCFCSGCQR